MTLRARQKHVAVREAPLLSAAQASVEISLLPRVIPEGREALRQQIVHQFRDGPVQVTDKFTEVLPALEVTFGVIMVVDQ